MQQFYKKNSNKCKKPLFWIQLVSYLLPTFPTSVVLVLVIINMKWQEDRKKMMMDIFIECLH